MTEQPRSSAKSLKYAFVIVFVILLANIGISIAAYFNIQNHLSILQETLITQEGQLRDFQQQFDILDYINETELLPWPRIYDQIKGSIVLIQTETGLGSGFVYDLEGHILTNHHVIADANTIQVTFLDGNITLAQKTGEDPYSDLAIIKVDPTVAALNPVVMGNSSTLQVGEPIAAIGNPFGLSDTITAGIIAALGRDLEAPENYLIVDIIQVDAAINPGNSGGPLVNLKGQVVGINTAIITSSGNFEGVGFAIPSNTVKREISDLIEKGTYIHPWVGVAGVDVDFTVAQDMGLEKPLGFLVTSVNSSSPAEEAGLQSNDVIVGVDEHTVRNLNDLAVYIERNKRPGDTTILTIIREGLTISLDLILGERPPPN